MAQDVETDVGASCEASFDHHSAAIARDPYPTYETLRSQCPVLWSTEYGGFWVLTDYPSVYDASRDDRTFLSSPSVGIPPFPTDVSQIPIDTDNPKAGQYRRILLSAYSPAAVTAMLPQIEAITDELIDAFASRGRCDLVRELAMLLPARVILELLGLPGPWEWYVDRVHTCMDEMVHQPEVSQRAAAELAGAVWEQMTDRRRNGFGDDQISLVMQGVVDGQPLPDAEIISYIVLLIFGGLDTTAAAMGNAFVILDRDQSLRRRLIAHPNDIGKAVEEFLRYQAPIQSLARTVARDVELGGRLLRAGDRTLLVWAAANRDPDMFERPDVVDIDRTPNRHLAFGVGLHRCLGSSLARAVFRIGLTRVLARLPDYRLADEPSQHRFPDCAVAYGLHALPIEFTPHAS